MKAVMCNSFGSVESLSLETVSDPAVNEDDIGVNVLAAGINFPDGLVVQGKYQVKPELPFIPGMELCGDVVSLGHKVTGLQVGDRIIASSSTFGAFAEKIALPAINAIKIPASIAPTHACNLLIAHGTAHHALKQRASLAAGENLVVLGAAGGTGLAAVQIGKAMGANVIAAASTDEKLTLAKSQGADHLVNYNEVNIKDAIRECTNGRGADVLYDPVGGELFDAGVRAMAPNGRYLVIGFASGTIPKLPANLALVKEFSLVGVFWGAFCNREPDTFAANMKELLLWHRNRDISVQIDQTFTLAETADALQYVMNRQAKGKVAIEVQQ